MSRAPNALQEAGDRPRRADLANEIDLPDVNAELEGGGGHQDLEHAPLQTLLGVKSLLLAEAAVVRSHLIVAQALGKLTGDPLGHASGVDENERGAVRLNELGQAIIDLGPDFGRHYGLERRRGDFKGE